MKTRRSWLAWLAAAPVLAAKEVAPSTPKNNECPVCHAMAEPYIRKTKLEEYGHLIGKIPPPPQKDLWPEMESTSMFIDRWHEDDAINRPTVLVGPQDHLVRCLNCNCAFYQDDARTMGDGG
jgi:hypothetical protein